MWDYITTLERGYDGLLEGSCKQFATWLRIVFVSEGCHLASAAIVRAVAAFLVLSHICGGCPYCTETLFWSGCPWGGMPCNAMQCNAMFFIPMNAFSLASILISLYPTPAHSSPLVRDQWIIDSLIDWSQIEEKFKEIEQIEEKSKEILIGDSKEEKHTKRFYFSIPLKWFLVYP